MPEVRIPEILLNNESYLLARQEALKAAGITSRRWQMQRKMITTQINARPDVQQGAIEGEYIIKWDDWSRGVAGEQANIPGTITWATNVDSTIEGALRSRGDDFLQTDTSYIWGNANQTPLPAKIIEFNNTLFVLSGAYVFSLATNVLTLDKAFTGLVPYIVDACVYNNTLIVSFGPRGIELPVKTAGTGTITMTSGGATTTGNTSGTCKIYYIKITTVGAQDKFRWSTDNTNWSAEINTVTSSYALENGVIIWFSDITGGAVTDRWNFASGPRIQMRNTSGTWTVATNAVRADYLAVVQNKLWYSVENAGVYSVASGADPGLIASRSGVIIVGDYGVPITDLNEYSERVAVSKENGLFLGDSRAIFPNVLPQITSVRHTDNGKNTLVRGSDIFYPHLNGLIRYNNGASEEIGLNSVFTSASTGPIGAGEIFPSTRISATCMFDNDIWVATRPSRYRIDKPTKFLRFVSPSTYVDATSVVTDNDRVTYSDIGGMASSGFFYVGFTSKFYGIWLDLRRVQTAASTMLVELSQGGGNWYYLTVPENLSAFFDDTQVNYKTLNRSGVMSIVPSGADLSSWATDSVNGSAQLYWARFYVNNTISNDTWIAECRVIVDPPVSHVWRGRTRQQGDLRQQSIVWQPMYASTDLVLPWISCMAPSNFYPFREGRAIVMACLQRIAVIWMNPSPNHPIYDGMAGKVWFCAHDGGMPELQKEFIDSTVKGRSIDASHTIDVSYYIDNGTSVTLASNIAASPTRTAFTSSTKGYSIRPVINFDAAASDTLTEVNQVEVRFRVLPTFKNEYTMIFELGTGQYTPDGGNLPDLDVQLSNLESLQGQPTYPQITLVDPAGRSKTVTVQSIKELEYVQVGTEPPVLLVEVVATEV